MRKEQATSYGLTKLNEAIPMICLYWGAKPSAVLGKERFKHLINARHSLRYLLSRDNNLSLSEIGTLTNGDHSSVIHSKKMFELYAEQDVKFQELRAIMEGVLDYKEHSSRNFRVQEVLTSKLNLKQKVKMLDTIYNE